MKLKSIICLGVSLLMAACSTTTDDPLPDPTPDTDPTPGVEEEKPDVPDEPDLTPMTEKEIINGNNAFAFNLFNAVLAETEPGENFCVAPFNVSTVLAMLANGADNETLDELCEALGVGKGDIETLNALYKSLIIKLPSVDERTTFRIANSVWASPMMPLYSSYIESVRDVFNADVFENINLRSPDGLTQINQWINSATDGKITKLYDVSSDPGMDAALISANLFKGTWSKQFDSDATYDDYFRSWDGEVTKVPTMHRTGDYSLSYTDNFYAGRLSYGNGSFRMTIIKVHPEDHFTKKDWDELEENGYVDKTKTEFSLPLFKNSTKKDITQTLKNMGMERAFAEKGNILTDYSRLSPESAWVDRVSHSVVIEVNEKGTEAAAVTGSDIVSSGPSDDFKVNRPFIYIIDEASTGTILFIGKINKII